LVGIRLAEQRLQNSGSLARWAGIAKIVQQLTSSGMRLAEQRLQNSCSLVTEVGIAKVAEQVT
jgi:hypothetical protein